MKAFPLLMTTILGVASCACSGGNGDGNNGDGDGDSSLAEQEAYWAPAEGQWVPVERAYSTDCTEDYSAMTFIDYAEPACTSLELNVYDDALLVTGSACDETTDRLGTSYSLSEDGRMLDSPLEFFQDGGAEYPCTWDRAQYELVLEGGAPLIVFWNWAVDFPGVVECPEELPGSLETLEHTCARLVYRLAPAGG